MKKPVLVLSLVLISFLLSAQEYFEWSQPEIITDTNSIYSNPFVSAFDNTSWMFYEKHEDKSSIYKMNLTDNEDIVLLLSSETVNYKYPVFYEKYSPNNFGFLFYLSDEEGADNLYATKLSEDNSLGAPIKIIQNLENKDVTDYSIRKFGYIAYTIDSVVYAAELIVSNDTVYTEEETTLDSSSFNIQISYREASWQKVESDSTHILYSTYSLSNGWEAPVYIDSIGNCQWLVKSHYISGLSGGFGYCWVKGDTVVGYSEYMDVHTINTFSCTDVRELSMINWYILVKEPYEEPHYLCFTTGLGDDSEIFSSHGEMGWEEGVYISDNNYPDDNPKVYFGEAISWDMYYVYCIWQTHINGKIALSMAKSSAYIGSAIEENSVIDNYLIVSPNPFIDRLNIGFNTYGQNAELKIYDINGRQVAGFENINSSLNWQSVVWQPTTKTSKGIYVVSLQLEGKTYTRKIVRQ